MNLSDSTRLSCRSIPFIEFSSDTMNRSSSGRAAGARVSGVTAGRSRGTASRWTSARSGLESINTRPSTIAAAIRFCVFTTGLQRRAHSTFSITSSRSRHSRFNASRPTVVASSLQKPFNSASWTAPSNSGPLHHDRRISTARSSAPIVPIGRNSGTQSIHGLQIETKLAEWQHHWNWHRPHTALGGLSPIDRVCERIDKTPLWETVEAAYDRTRERIRIADYRLDKALDELK